MTARIRLATAPINWGITSGDYGENPDPDALLRTSATVGYTGCELGPLDYFGESSEAIAERFSRYGLEVVAFWVDLPLATPISSAHRTHIAAISSRLSDLGARYLIVSDLITPERLSIVSRVPHFPEQWWSPDDWNSVRNHLTSLAEVAGQSGVSIAVHPHVGGHIETGEEINRLLEAIENTDIRLCIDTGHIRIGGIDAIPLLEQEMPRVAHVHAKDVDAEVLKRLQMGDLSYEAAVGEGLYCDLGRGLVDWQGFRRALHSSSYAGWVVAEQDRLMTPGSRAPFESNERNFSFLSSLFGD